MSRIRIGELLVSQGALDPIQLESALAHQRRWGGRLGRSIVHLGFLDEGEMLAAVGAQLGVPVVQLAPLTIAREVLALVPERLIRTRRVLPLAKNGEGRRAQLDLAVSDAMDLRVLDEVSFVTGLRVNPILASDEDLDDAISRHLDGRPLRAAAFTSRTDAIDLPADTNPLSVLRRGDFGDPTLH